MHSSQFIISPTTDTYIYRLDTIKIGFQDTILNFGVSRTILNPDVIFRRWCKLNLRPMRGKVKSHQFSERIGARR